MTGRFTEGSLPNILHLCRVWVERALVGPLFYEIVHNNNRERKCHIYQTWRGNHPVPPKKRKRKGYKTKGTEGKDYCVAQEKWAHGSLVEKIVFRLTNNPLDRHNRSAPQSTRAIWAGPYGGGRQKTTANGTSKLLNDSLRMVNLLSSRSFCGKQGENKPQHQHKISDRKTGDGRVAKWYTGGYFPVKHFLCCRDGYVHMEHLQHIIIHRWNGLNDISQAGARRVVVEGLQARNFPGEQSLFSLVRDGETWKHAYANYHLSLASSYLLGGGQKWLGCTRSHLAILRSFPSFLFFFYRM